MTMRVSAAAVLLALIATPASPASAQIRGSAEDVSVDVAALPEITVDDGLPGSFAASEVAVPAAAAEPQILGSAVPRSLPKQPGPVKMSSMAKRVSAAIVLGVVGMFAGGAMGAAMEGGSCNCDDPGMFGFMIGMPVGAAIGAVLGMSLGR